MSTRPSYIIALILSLALLAGCTSSEKPGVGQEEQNPTIAASIFPVYDLVRNVAGDDATVVLILQPGSSPHTFDPTPSALKKLEGTDIFFSIGLGLDGWVSNLTSTSPGAREVSLERGVELRASEEEDEGPHDSHYWLSPANAAIMVQTIADELSREDPANAADYAARAAAYNKSLMQKVKEWQAELADLPTKEIVTFHDAFFYFADEFGLTIVTTFEPFPGKEPTPSYLSEVKTAVEEHGIKVLFTEPQLSADTLKQFAQDNGVRLDILDPLGGIEGRQSYTELIGYNVHQVIKNLTPETTPTE